MNALYCVIKYSLLIFGRIPALYNIVRMNMYVCRPLSCSELNSALTNNVTLTIHTCRSICSGNFRIEKIVRSFPRTLGRNSENPVTFSSPKPPKISIKYTSFSSHLPYFTSKQFVLYRDVYIFLASRF